MTLEDRINDDIKSAILAKETTRLTALRAVKAAILIEKTAGTAHEVTDADVTKIMQRLVKQRRESAAVYTDAGRGELAASELAEAAVIEQYLPQQMSEGELEEAVRAIIAETGASAPSDMGRVMGIATKRLAGKADGRAISELVKRLLK